MNNYKYINLRQMPHLKEEAAQWFHLKWSLPKEAYLEAMEAYLKKETPWAWYLCLDDNRIVAGLGIIENDFHQRKDLSPNLCALYTEKDHRCQGLAKNLLDLAVKDMKAQGISPVYLITDHTSFYEKYGWEFLSMVKEDHTDKKTRLYIHR